MATLFITAIMAIAAYTATVTVLKVLRAEERELSYLEPFELAPGGREGPK